MAFCTNPTRWVKRSFVPWSATFAIAAWAGAMFSVTWLFSNACTAASAWSASCFASASFFSRSSFSFRSCSSFAFFSFSTFSCSSRSFLAFSYFWTNPTGFSVSFWETSFWFEQAPNNNAVKIVKINRFFIMLLPSDIYPRTSYHNIRALSITNWWYLNKKSDLE